MSVSDSNIIRFTLSKARAFVEGSAVLWHYWKMKTMSSYFSLVKAFIFQDIDPDVIESYSNNILTAIVHGMKSSEPNDHVRLAATTALLNSLEFTKQNFDRETERHFIMQVTFSTINLS